MLPPASEFRFPNSGIPENSETRLSESDGGQAQLEYWNDGRNCYLLIACPVKCLPARALQWQAGEAYFTGVTCYSNN